MNGRIFMFAAGALLLVQPAVARADTETLPVARIAIYPGDPISDQMLEDRPINLRPGISGRTFAGRAQIVGKVAKRTLLPGQPVPLNAIKEADIIRSGKPVTLVFAAGGLMITARGLALQSGGAGEAVSVQSSETGVVLRGTVQPDGTVRMEE